MNNYTAIVNLCRAPEELELGGRKCMKLRLADNTFGKNSETRFFNAIVSGNDAEVAARLASGDQICLSGTLVATSYKAKKGKNKGKTMQADEMPFAKILQVTKSPTFFAGKDDEGEADAADESEPDLADADTGDTDPADDPLADLK